MISPPRLHQTRIVGKKEGLVQNIVDASSWALTDPTHWRHLSLMHETPSFGQFGFRVCEEGFEELPFEVLPPEGHSYSMKGVKFETEDDSTYLD